MYASTAHLSTEYDAEYDELAASAPLEIELTRPSERDLMATQVVIRQSIA
jgi:hypothetical protein